MFRSVLVSALMLGAAGDFCPAADKRVSWGGDGGDAFDDCNDQGLKGGITQVCARGASWMNLFTTYYADTKSEHGGQGGDWSCFNLMLDEVITEARVCWGQEWGRTVVFSVNLKTNQGRHSPTWGTETSTCESATAPDGEHLVSVFGRAAKYLDHIGFAWGTGGNGIGQWTQKSCGGCSGTWDVDTKECTTTSESHSKDVTSAWTLAAKTDLNLGFKLKGFGVSADREISGSYSHSVTEHTSSSFERTDCSDITRHCDKKYFYQWEVQTTMGTRTPDTTLTEEWWCSDSPIACCLPGTFSSDPSDCDLDRNAPNTCDSVAITV